MAEELDYFQEYMNEAAGEPTLIVRGVLLFFKSAFSNEGLDALEQDISYQETYNLKATHEVLLNHNVPDEISRQILALLNKKFKEALEKKEMTEKKMDFIRTIKKKH
ncbi:MAG: hypothetical protein JXA54_07160 [Candidatus Heimdallarchaeota archaeon]|nr:hypothetical protein [Candidatus Heimdallarchaeota archaeon]